MESVTTVYLVAAVCDACGVQARPGAVAVRNGRVTAAGRVEHVCSREEKIAKVIEMPQMLILPAMVNAHAHLDLTSVGTIPYRTTAAGVIKHNGFVDWLQMIMRLAPVEPPKVDAAVRQGLAISRQAGVGYIGDIARTTASIEARVRDPQTSPGVSFLECFGVVEPTDQAAVRISDQLSHLEDRIATTSPGLKPDRIVAVHVGLQPHAPYSAGQGIYEAACRLANHSHALRLSTHVAETIEEIQFVRNARGPFVELLKAMGKWSDTIAPAGLHPIDWLAPRLREHPWLLAHCNYVDDSHIKTLADCGASVAYCPIASDYFGHRGHRYREMLDAGVNVCLGTDSIVCQDTTNPQPLGILPQMRHLYRRDNTDPRTLLEMATVNGMKALGLAPQLASLTPGGNASLIGIPIDPTNEKDPLTQGLEQDTPVQWIDTHRVD